MYHFEFTSFISLNCLATKEMKFGATTTLPHMALNGDLYSAEITSKTCVISICWGRNGSRVHPYASEVSQDCWGMKTCGVLGRDIRGCQQVLELEGWSNERGLYGHWISWGWWRGPSLLLPPITMPVMSIGAAWSSRSVLWAFPSIKQSVSVTCLSHWA